MFSQDIDLYDFLNEHEFIKKYAHYIFFNKFMFLNHECINIYNDIYNSS